MVHKSISLPQPYLRTISGAQQMLVPAYVLLMSFYLTYLARPKSVSFAQPFSKMRIFSGLRSRYIMFLECRYSMPKIRQPRINRTAGSPAFLKSSKRFDFQFIKEQVSPPWANSITKQRYLGSRNAQQRVVMKLHLDSCNIFFQSLILEVSFLLKISDLGMRFIAYFYNIPFALFSISSPKNTSPNPPQPMRCVTSKCSHLIYFLSLGKGYFSSISLMTPSQSWMASALASLGGV